MSRRPVPPAYERAAEKALVEKGLPSRKGFATGTTWVRTFDEACIDFESLLFHGRAGLDVLTRFIAGEHGQYNESFSDLRKILANNCPQTDSRGLQTLRILDEAPGVTGVLVDVPGEPGESAAKSMRSKVAHYTSLQQGLRSAFTMSRLENGRLLIFDASALGYPVLATARVLAQDVPFVMLAGLATYLATPGKLTRAGCAPEWRNPTVVFDDFVDLENRKLGVNFGVVRPDINGFAVHWDRLRPEVVRAAIPFTPPEIA